MQIHPTALVDPHAKLAEGVTIGPYAVIGPEVEVGKETKIENNVTLKGKTQIGERNYIGSYSTIGFPAQDKACRHDNGRVVIGHDNDIREFVSIHTGTSKEEYLTQIGNHNQIFVYCHFAHDTSLGDHCMLANNTTLGGHVKIGSHVVTGGLSAYHQFTRVGDYAMIGGMSAMYQDVPPYLMCSGSRGKAYGINVIGLKRQGFGNEEVERIQEIYNTYFCSGLIPAKALAAVETLSNGSEIYHRFIDFVKSSKRGLITRG